MKIPSADYQTKSNSVYQPSALKEDTERIDEQADSLQSEPETEGKIPRKSPQILTALRSLAPSLRIPRGSLPPCSPGQKRRSQY